LEAGFDSQLSMTVLKSVMISPGPG